jgi:hypothetical protein
MASEKNRTPQKHAREFGPAHESRYKTLSDSTSAR